MLDNCRIHGVLGFWGVVAATGATVQHSFTAVGAATATVTAEAPDGRTSAPCVTAVTVQAAPSFTGHWVLNPASAAMTGCTLFTASFPAATLDLVQTGSTMTAAPAGNGYPAGNPLAGSEDPLPAPPGTFRLSRALPTVDKGTPCGVVTQDHSVQLDFTSATAVTGTWRIVFTASCLPGCGAACNCVAQGAFSGVKP